MLINSHKQIISGTFPYILGTSKLFHIFFSFLVRISQYSCVTYVHWVNLCINSAPSKITRLPFVFLHYRNFQLYPLLIYDIACCFVWRLKRKLMKTSLRAQIQKAAIPWIYPRSQRWGSFHQIQTNVFFHLLYFFLQLNTKITAMPFFFFCENNNAILHFTVVFFFLILVKGN